MADKGKIKGGVVTDDEWHDEIERKSKGREECGENADVESLVHFFSFQPWLRCRQDEVRPAVRSLRCGDGFSDDRCGRGPDS
ncbi:hypothetical protein ABIA16_005474 [Sinorhizobium fredii]